MWFVCWGDGGEAVVDEDAGVVAEVWEDDGGEEAALAVFLAVGEESEGFVFEGGVGEVVGLFADGEGVFWGDLEVGGVVLEFADGVLVGWWAGDVFEADGEFDAVVLDEEVVAGVGGVIDVADVVPFVVGVFEEVEGGCAAGGGGAVEPFLGAIDFAVEFVDGVGLLVGGGLGEEVLEVLEVGGDDGGGEGFEFLLVGELLGVDGVGGCGGGGVLVFGCGGEADFFELHDAAVAVGAEDA